MKKLTFALLGLLLATAFVAPHVLAESTQTASDAKPSVEQSMTDITAITVVTPGVSPMGVPAFAATATKTWCESGPCQVDADCWKACPNARQVHCRWATICMYEY